MKRIRVAKGRHVMISAELADKASRVFGTGLSRKATQELAALEPKGSSTLMAGSAKPLALSRALARSKKKDDGVL